jgi:phosphatidate cytidylyltransferase
MPFMTQNMSMGWRMSFSLFCVFLLFCGMIRVHTVVTIDNLCYMIATTMLATFSMSCLVTLLRSDDFHGVYYVILCLAGAWMGDSGAFFIGRKFGKHKLAPDISPKKTVEGAVAGVVTVAVVFVGFSFAYQIFCGYVYDVFFTVNLLLVGIMGIACGVLGIIGDLSASVIKRSTGIKDFGNIMPGHGGLMDRFDSVLFVAPFMAMIIQMTSGVVPESNMPKLLFFL